MFGVALSVAATQQPSLANEGRTANPKSAQTLAEVRAQLRADDDAIVAWGAYHAVRLGLREAVPDLERALRMLAEQAATSTERQACVAAVLDALVQLDARLPVDELEGWWQREPKLGEAVLILASREPKACTAFLSRRLADSLSAVEWQAVCNLLLGADPKGLARQLAAELRLRVEVVVRKPGFSSAIMSAIFGDSIVHAPEAFPPRVQYRIVDRATSSSVCFAPGPNPIHYTRTAHARNGGSFSCQRYVSEFDRDDYRLRCLAQILGTTIEEIGLRGTTRSDYAWGHALAYRIEVSRQLGEVRERLQAFLDRLAAKGLIAADPGLPVAPRIDVAIDDQRGEGAPELPELRF